MMTYARVVTHGNCWLESDLEDSPPPPAGSIIIGDRYFPDRHNTEAAADIGSVYMPATKTLRLTLFVPTAFNRSSVDVHSPAPAPGSLLDVRVKHRSGEVATRPYSIASTWVAYRMSWEDWAYNKPPSEFGRVYELFIRIVDGGKLSSLVVDKILEEALPHYSIPIEDPYTEGGAVDMVEIPPGMFRQEEVRGNSIMVSSPYRMFPVDEQYTESRVSAHDPKMHRIRIDRKAFYASGTGIAPFLLYLQSLHNLSLLAFEDLHVALPESLETKLRQLEDQMPQHVTLMIKNRLELLPGGYAYTLLYYWDTIVRYFDSKGNLDKHPLQLNLVFTRELDEAHDDIRKLVGKYFPYSYIEQERFLSIYGQDRAALEHHTEDKLYAQDILRGYLEEDKKKRSPVKVYAAGYGDMLRALGSVSQREFKRPHYLFAYEAFTA